MTDEMRLSKHVMAETLKTQHDELDYIQSKLDELHLCFEGIGMMPVSGQLEGYSDQIRAVCQKIEAVIESLEGD